MESTETEVSKIKDIRLDFGCGDNPKKGYLGVDIRDLPEVEYVCNAWEIESFVTPRSVSKVRSHHFLEHLTFSQVESTLLSWFNILRPQGKVNITVPDIAFHIKQFTSWFPDKKSKANKAWTNREHAIAGFWGWQREGDTKLWDVHKCGFDEILLRSYLESAGFIDIKRLPNKPWHLQIEGTKPKDGFKKK